MRTYKANVNGQDYIIKLEMVGDTAPAVAPVAPVAPVATPAAAPAPVAMGNGEKVLAPMPGTILDVKVSNGQAVKKGDLLFILEAMKMENEIFASQDGKVANVAVQKGASVTSGQALCELV